MRDVTAVTGQNLFHHKALIQTIRSGREGQGARRPGPHPPHARAGSRFSATICNSANAPTATACAMTKP